MSSIREVVENRQPVGLNERLIFRLTTTNWGSAPTSIVVASFKYDDETYTNNTTSVFPVNSPSVNGDIISLSPLVPQAISDVYYITVKFTSGGSIWESFFWVDVER